MLSAGRRVAKLLGRDLEQAVEKVGRLARIVPITGLPSPFREMVTFRLHFADGLILKGRRLSSAAHAGRMHQIVGALPEKGMPNVVATHGVAVLEEWVRGTALRAGRVSPDESRRCGGLLGSIHAAHVPTSLAHTAYDSGRALVQRRRDRLLSQLRELIEGGVVSSEFASQLVDIAALAAPDLADVGFLHGDFCPENIIRDPAGRLWCVDNATVSLDAHDLDLSRTVYRWQMTPIETVNFFDGYSRHRDPASFRAHYPFWMVCVLVDSVVKRHRARLSSVSAPMEQLLALHDRSTERAKSTS